VREERSGWSPTQPPSCTAIAGGYVTMIHHSKREFNTAPEKTFVSQLQNEQIFAEIL